MKAQHQSKMSNSLRFIIDTFARAHVNAYTRSRNQNLWPTTNSNVLYTSFSFAEHLHCRSARHNNPIQVSRAQANLHVASTTGSGVTVTRGSGCMCLFCVNGQVRFVGFLFIVCLIIRLHQHNRMHDSSCYSKHKIIFL